jgi:myo-inositol catabolism protein IolC
MVGCPVLTIPVFDTKEQLDAIMREAGAEYDRIKQIKDGYEFMLKLPEDIAAVYKLRWVDGRLRYLLLKRPQ